MLLSVIIPAYNAEKYIGACLDSLFVHLPEGGISEAEMEVIVVDDGSTDQTPILLAEYASRHSQIKVLHQQNQGQSVARNLAIEVAQGDYIYMVDADDEMMGPLPVATMRKGGYDIIGVQVMYREENGTERPWSHQMEQWPFDEEYSTGASFVSRHNIEGLVYGYLFNRQLFALHPELRFTPGIYHQDEELIFKIFTLAQRTIYKQGYVYRYYERSGSSLNTRTEQRKRKLMDDCLTILRNLIAWRDRLGKNDPRTKTLQEVMHYKLSYLSMDILRMLIRGSYEPNYIKQIIGEMKALGFYPLPHIADTKYQGMKWLTCHPTLVCWWARSKRLKSVLKF